MIKYFFEYSYKFIYFTLTIIFESFFIKILNLDADQIIATHWWLMFSLPLILLIFFIPPTHFRTSLIQNFIITTDALHIIYVKQNTQVINYQDIYDASSIYGGTGIELFRISYYCQTTKKRIDHYPLFDEIISIFNIYPIKNKHKLIASFLE